MHTSASLLFAGPSRIRLFLCMSLVAFAGLLTGCGGADSRTPEELARETFAAIKANDYGTYKDLCVTVDDLLGTMETALATGEVSDRDRQSFEKAEVELETKFALLEAEVKRDFEAMVREIDWSAIDIDKVDIETRVRRGVEEARVQVRLNNGKTLEIDEVIMTPSGWRIADNRPLRLRAAPSVPKNLPAPELPSE